MKNKIIFLIIIMIFSILPFNVLACPHSDSNSEPHFQFYDSDYTVVSMLYPRKNYLYSKDVPLDSTGNYDPKNDDKIIKEAFGFPLEQDKQAYYENYWFSDTNLQTENWQGHEIQTTIKGIDNFFVSSINYNLNIGLKNTYDNSRKYVNDKLYQMYYNIYVDKLNEDESETKYNNIIKKNNLVLITPEIMEIKSKIIITNSLEYDYSSESINVTNLYDPIEVQIISSVKSNNSVVINLEELDNLNYIECNYNEEKQYYSFNINKTGVYIIVDKDKLPNKIETITNDKTNDRDKLERVSNNENNNFPIIIGGSIIGVVVLIGLIMVFKIKR